MPARFLVIAVAVFLPGWATAAEHPAHGIEPNDIRGGYTITSDRSINDLTFTTMDQRPSYDSLSDLEKYMINGAKPGPGVPGDMVMAWYQKIYTFVNNYYWAYGEIPDQLTDKELRRYSRHMTVDSMQLYRNPLTGEWPRLQEANHSPGDLYMRYLTKAEMRQLAPKGDWRYRIWFEGRQASVFEVLANPDQPQDTMNVTLRLPPMYIRVYGREGVIMDGVTFITSPSTGT